MSEFISWMPGDIPDSTGRRQVDRPPPIGCKRHWFDGGIRLRTQKEQLFDLLKSPLLMLAALLSCTFMWVLHEED